MQPTPFSGSRAKLERGESHIRELTKCISDHLARKPVAVVISEKWLPLGGYLIGIHQHTLIKQPDELSMIFGDAVHNMRVSLDVAVNEAMGMLTNKTYGKFYFPFASSKDELPKQIASKMRGAPQALVGLVEGFRPYHGGNQLLRGLHDLDIKDKHVISIGLSARFTTGPIQVLRDRLNYSNIRMDSVPPEIVPKLDIKPGAKIKGMVRNPQLEPVISEGFPLKGSPVIETLENMRNLTSSILDDFQMLSAP